MRTSIRVLSQPTAAQLHEDLADDFVVSPAVSLSSSGAELVVGDEALKPLGVVRDPEEDEEQEFSRLGLPLTNPRKGAPSKREPSRALTLSEINSKLSEAEFAAGRKNTKGATDASSSPLPFDDEHFAEAILQMDVEGALDETWQDSRKAHIEDVKALVGVLRDMKVRDITAIDVSQKTSNFDYIVVGTCEGSRHIHLAAWAVQESDRVNRTCKISRQKTDHLWEVVPVGRIVVNLMQESYRNDVNLERKWAVTKSMDPLSFANSAVSEGRQSKSHGIWTLTVNLQDLEDFEVDYCKDILLSQR